MSSLDSVSSIEMKKASTMTTESDCITDTHATTKINWCIFGNHIKYTREHVCVPRAECFPLYCVVANIHYKKNIFFSKKNRKYSKHHQYFNECNNKIQDANHHINITTKHTYGGWSNWV